MPALIDHTKEDHCENRCTVCEQNFESSRTLIRHFKKCHPSLLKSEDNDSDNTTFTLCDDETDNRSSSFCNICGCGPFIGNQSLESHYRNHEPKRFACDLCHAEYNDRTLFESHKIVHQTNLLYACNVCNEGFSTTSNLSSHIRRLHGKTRVK